MTSRIAQASRAASALLLALAVTALAACDGRPASTAETQRNVDVAAEKTKDAAVAAGHKAADLADKARDKTKAYFESPEVRKDVSNAKDAVKDAIDGGRNRAADDPNRK